MSVITPLIAGNWKMNGTAADLEQIARLSALLAEAKRSDLAVLVCPPVTLLSRAVADAGDSDIAFGGQDCHAKMSGAHTGDVSAEMIADAGGRYVIVGHSERRSDHGESDAIVATKARAAARAGLVPVICVGETGAERDAGEADKVVSAQIAASVPTDLGATVPVLAYEPVWAIGTGKTPTLDDIAAMHATIRDRLVARLGADGRSAQILYGGSVKPANAEEILAIADVDGALVGGASLDAESFFAIIAAAPRRA